MSGVSQSLKTADISFIDYNWPGTGNLTIQGPKLIIIILVWLLTVGLVVVVVVVVVTTVRCHCYIVVTDSPDTPAGLALLSPWELL